MTSQETKQQQLADLLALAPVVPVVIVDDVAHAVPMARALVAGGIRTI
ncbi:MAG TPA: keto-deoxy-phosphogluconate aldolase, partial [Rhodanobacter sp.]|nr:keto-deoxy-phosphogluconate aldolase [Rhodanobacter sp.]